MEYPNNLLALRTTLRLSQSRVADAIGVSQPEYGRIELGRRQIGTHAQKLADLFEVDIDALTETPEAPEHDQGYVSLTMPVHGRPIDRMRLDFKCESIEMTSKPSHMAGNKDAYAVYCPGDHMAPRVRAGELLFIDPWRAIKSSDLVLVQLNDNDERAIYEYVSESDQSLTLKSLSSDEPVVLEKFEGQVVHPVAGIKFL